MCIDLGMSRAISSKNNEETTKSTLVSCLLIFKVKVYDLINNPTSISRVFYVEMTSFQREIQSGVSVGKVLAL